MINIRRTDLLRTRIARLIRMPRDQFLIQPNLLLLPHSRNLHPDSRSVSYRYARLHQRSKSLEIVVPSLAFSTDGGDTDERFSEANVLACFMV